MDSARIDRGQDIHENPYNDENRSIFLHLRTRGRDEAMMVLDSKMSDGRFQMA
jgi:hypothetical protein